MRTAEGQAATFASKTRTAFGSLTRYVGGFFAAYEGVRFLGDALKEAEEAQRVGRQTNAVLKSTGGAARVSAIHIERLSDKLARLAGTDDEAVQAMNNWLLTFKNIKNVGADKIFDRASEAAVNLAAAIGAKTGGRTEDNLAGAATMLGKALNDPLAGLTALQRAGITFTDSQKDMIRSFVEAGDILSAQKVILGEVESQVAGSAAANATAADKMRVAWENVKESVGTLVLPVLERLAEVMQDFSDWVSANKDDIKQVFKEIGDVFAWTGQAIADAWNGVIYPTLKFFYDAGAGLYYGLSQLFSGIAQGFSELGSAFQGVVDWVNAHKDEIATGLRIAFYPLFTAYEVAKKLLDLLNGAKWPNMTPELKAFIQGGGGGGSGGGFHQRQHGGPVSPGRPYIVGERRPELFVPNSAGRILPSVPGMGGGGTTVILNVAGTVVSEGRLIDKIHEGLLAKKRKSGALNL